MMAFGWPQYKLVPFLFIGLVPLFFAFNSIARRHYRQTYHYTFIAVFVAHSVWLMISNYWLYLSSPRSYFIGVIIESLILGLFLSPVTAIGKRYGNLPRFFYFLSVWILIEYSNQQWLLGTPYYILGNGLGMYPWMIQHYEWIGIEGGTVWILVVNFLIYTILYEYKTLGLKNRKIIWVLVILILPVVCSIRKLWHTDPASLVTVAAIHTSFDDNERKQLNDEHRITDTLMKISEAAAAKNAVVSVWPESLINNAGWLSPYKMDSTIDGLTIRLRKYPSMSVCAGGFAFSQLDYEEGKKDPYSDVMKDYKVRYIVHNTAFILNSTGNPVFRCKEEFVPFQERIPFLKQFPAIAHLADIVGSNIKISPFPNEKEAFRIGSNIYLVPVLCYESVFPLKMAGLSEDASCIAILANESWNKSASGSVQYLYNHIGIAIQSRIPVVKSSNYGISTIIDKNGKILGQKQFKDQGVIVADIEKKEETTLYEMIAGYTYWISLLIFVTLILFLWIKRKNK